MRKFFVVEAVKDGNVHYRAYQQAVNAAQAIELAKMHGSAPRGSQWSALRPVVCCK